MRFLVLLGFTLLLLNNNVGGKDKDKGRSTTEEKTISGEVSRTSGVSVIYRIGEYSVARSANRHVSDKVGSIVEANCLMKKNRVLRIKSITVTGKADTENKVMTVSGLHRRYKDTPGKTIQLYRNKELSFSASVTGISNYGINSYQLTLDKNKGQMIIKAFLLSPELRKQLWKIGKKVKEVKKATDEKDKKKKSSLKIAGPVRISFTGKWKSQNNGKIIFREVTSIN